MSLIRDSKVSVEDPSDWSGTTMPSVSTLDSMLRCQICKGFLRAPVVTSCGHIFCSICVREALSTKGKCPLCQEEIFESGLRKVLLLDGVVEWFKKSRDELLSKLKKVEVVSDSQEESTDRLLSNGSSDVIDLTDDVSFSEGKANKSTKSTTEQQTLDIRHCTDGGMRRSSSSSETVNDADMLVQCPVCSKFMTIEKLQGSHIDKCLRGESDEDYKPENSSPKKRTRKGKRTGSIFRDESEINKLLQHHKKRKHEDTSFQLQSERQRIRQRIPNLDAMISTNKLREKLNSYGLHTNGSRQRLEARMKQYINLYNANLDALHPVDDRVLIGRLSRWESLLDISERQDEKSRDDGKSNTTKAIQKAKQNARDWKIKYRNSYKELIKRARGSMTAVKNQDDETKIDSQANEKNPKINKEESISQRENALKQENTLK
mgnify:CR=1 FL=1